MLDERDWDSPETLQAKFDAAHDASRADPAPAWDVRRDRLLRLRAMLRDGEGQLIRAISADFGQRAAGDTKLAEIFPSHAEIAHALRHGRSWMRPRRVPTAIWFRPARSLITPQPKGVVGIIAPWNYPLFMVTGPVTGAFAAGNRVVVKTSEFVPEFGRWLADAVADHFAPDEFSVARGGPEIGAAFSSLPFDHLFFTGNGAVGRKVMAAAAANLTPVTLELGGKSPALLTENADLDRAVARIMTGKMLNSGQTCVAPDHVLLTPGSTGPFIDRARAWTRRHYPDIAANPDVTRIIDARQYDRLIALRDDAAARGATLHPLTDAPENAETRFFPPTIVTGAPADSAILRDEIFGPLLPLIEVDGPDAMVDAVNARPRPLAAYYFSRNAVELRDLSSRILSGGACYNDTILHVAQSDLPFGGVGASGMGAYHGRTGFDTFSHLRGTFIQSRVNGVSLLAPPYRGRFGAMLNGLQRLVRGRA